MSSSRYAPLNPFPRNDPMPDDVYDLRLIGPEGPQSRSIWSLTCRRTRSVPFIGGRAPWGHPGGIGGLSFWLLPSQASPARWDGKFAREPRRRLGPVPASRFRDGRRPD